MPAPAVVNSGQIKSPHVAVTTWGVAQDGAVFCTDSIARLPAWGNLDGLILSGGESHESHGFEGTGQPSHLHCQYPWSILGINMGVKVGGERPRPRVALLGQFPEDDLQRFMRMFPTVWSSLSIEELEEQVDVREVDLLIIAAGVADAKDWAWKSHVICFSRDLYSLPGPTNKCNVLTDQDVTTEEFLLPDVPLPVSRLRDADLGHLGSVKGLPTLHLVFQTFGIKKQPEQAMFEKTAIICEGHTKKPLAVAFVRERNNLGVAWLPFSPLVDQAAWVEVLVTLWAESDKVRLPHFGDWADSPEWMTPEEERIQGEIKHLEQAKQQYIAELDRQIGEATVRFAETQREASLGLKRLLTAQDDELVDAVSKVLQDIGFRVENVDKRIPQGRPRREDLRLKQPAGLDGEWEAILEVRGYARSSGKTSDLQRIERFAGLYAKEKKGRLPDKRLYIVNGPLELSPSQRDAPLASAQEDIETFSESDGIVVSTLDLFKAIKTFGPEDYPAIRESIQNCVGRWSARNVASVKRAREIGAVGPTIESPSASTNA